MSDDAERIREQMRHLRQDLGAEVKDIVWGAKQLADWRYYVRNYPWACVGGAFVLGFLAIPGRRKPLDAETQRLVEQLKRHGLTAAMSVAPLSPAGLAGRLLTIAGPIVLKGVTQLIAQQFKPGDASRPNEPPRDPSHLP